MKTTNPAKHYKSVPYKKCQLSTNKTNLKSGRKLATTSFVGFFYLVFLKCCHEPDSLCFN